MHRCLRMVVLAIVLWPAIASAEIETRLVCQGSSCDFVLLGGTSADRSLTLQPNISDPRSGRLRLNGFTDLFPDWRPPASAGMDLLYSWKPTATWAEGSSVRLFEVAPNLTIPNATGSALFAVTGSLTRTGNYNPLYQWTGFYFGTNFRSAASAICIAGPNLGNACTGDAQCPDGRCEGGSPLYQDAFFDGALAEQRRGHAIQHTWIPISFLTKPALKAGRSCGGGQNDDTPCTADGQCTGGGTCQAAYLEQDAFYGFYAQPSFQEVAGATLISRDYAAVVLENPYVAGAPQIDRFTGLLCDPMASDWSRLPAETTKSCLASLGPAITSRHAGAFRIGDARQPIDKLEVNGTLSLDTGGDGTINGSKTPGSGLSLNPNSSADAPGALRIGRTFTAVPERGWTLLLNENELELNSAASLVTFSDFAGRWVVTADGAAGRQGFVGARFRPVITGGPEATARSSGSFVQQMLEPTFVAGGGAGDASLAVDAVVGLAVQPTVGGDAPAATGQVVVRESTTARDAPRIEEGGQIATRRGLALLDKQGKGAQSTVVAVDVADQTVEAYAAALRSGMSRGDGKWHLALRGTADSSIGGSVAVGPSEETVPRARLHVQEQTPNAEAVRIETRTENDDPVLRMFQQRVSTSDGATATLQEFQTERDHSYLIEARVVARCTAGTACGAGASAAYVRRVLAQNAQGKLTCIGQGGGAGTEFVAEAVAAWEAVIECQGADVRVRVSGGANSNVAWHNTLIVQGLSS